MKSLNFQRGFTLIELLVVIAVIGVLSGILFVAIDPSDKILKAQATKVLADLRSIESAFILAAGDREDFVYFPKHVDIGYTNPWVETLVQDGFLKNIPDVLYGPLSDKPNRKFIYVNGGFEYNYMDNCPGVYTPTGAHIAAVLNAEDMDLVYKLDEIIDDSDGFGCGKFIYGGSYMRYIMSDNK